MTTKELEAVGFRLWFRGQTSKYQKSIRDAEGVRYFIDVEHFPAEVIGSCHLPDTFEITLQVNNGCGWFPDDAALRILIYSGISRWSVTELEAVAEEIHRRLDCRRYE